MEKTSEQREAIRAGSQRNMQELGRKAACFDDLVEALEGVVSELLNRMRPGEVPGRIALRRGQAALAKAKGES